ncbi:hypothetical protein [Nocardiopsis exhalans]|uniref:hypothetical protein n=1 Tax=Nocardiopsis exhalans TaxID=163604 RepID=UPI0031D06C6B
MTVFSLGFGTDPETGLGYERTDFLVFLLIGVVFFGVFTPISGLLADKFGRKPVLITVTSAIIVFGFAMGPLLGSGSTVGILTIELPRLRSLKVIGAELLGEGSRVVRDDPLHLRKS